MHFYQTTEAPKVDVRYNSCDIEEGNVVFLCVDSQLNWKAHTHDLSKRIN